RASASCGCGGGAQAQVAAQVPRRLRPPEAAARAAHLEPRDRFHRGGVAIARGNSTCFQ
ncbi:unnamed protein product, partial [Musa acuminata subsp. burmannicoides]